MVRKINNINRLILPKQHYSFQSHSRPSILKPLNPNSIVNFRSRDVTYVTQSITTRDKNTCRMRRLHVANTQNKIRATRIFIDYYVVVCYCL